MNIVDPGHRYKLTTIDGDIDQILQFVKREGEGYPGNFGHYPGTIIQEVLRACIDRVKYVNNQIPDTRNQPVIDSLRTALYYLELRAAERHGKKLPESLNFHELELLPVGKNGHLLCGAGEE